MQHFVFLKRPLTSALRASSPLCVVRVWGTPAGLPSVDQRWRVRVQGSWSSGRGCGEQPVTAEEKEVHKAIWESSGKGRPSGNSLELVCTLGTAWSPSAVWGQPGTHLRSGDSLEPVCRGGLGRGSGWRHFQQRGSSRAPACSTCSVQCPTGWGRHLRSPGVLGSSPRGLPAILSHQGCVSLCVWRSGAPDVVAMPA